MRFKGKWRDYQARVLDDADALLSDGRLHVVAAPGSGKTTLGLEVVRRIARPALVLAPSLTIRNQWAERLRHSFLEPGARAAGEISLSLEEVRPFTVTTYQALHARWGQDGTAASGDAFSAMVAARTAMGPLTIVLDEAHHLRREWWRALKALIAQAGHPTIVSLTATPPYDVPFDEWQRYEQVCGPIDCEISIPELVRNGDLCPHQDYVLVSTPAASEAEIVCSRREGLTQLFDLLLADSSFLDRLVAHPWIAEPEAHEAAILDAPELLSAILIFLAAAERALPRAPMAMLGAEPDDLPRLSPRWMEVLLQGVLFEQRGHFPDPAWRRRLKNDLRRLGAIEGKHVRIAENKSLVAMLANNSAKVDSIVRIAEAEVSTLGERLRMVVLTDHVRASDLPSGNDLRPEPAKLGVASIFDALRLAATPARIGAVSGSLVILPEAALPSLRASAARSGVPTDAIRAPALEHCPGYARITFADQDNHRLVEILTRLFNDGEITLLVGTLALLGEGWDAPSINALVLASNTGSYMMSNQMRGRAIRTDPHAPDKVANIWHLATAIPEDPSEPDPAARRSAWDQGVSGGHPASRALGSDLALLERRFRAFSGVTYEGLAKIESGPWRLGLFHHNWTAASIDAFNGGMIARSALRESIAARWRVAIGGAERRNRPDQRQMRQLVRASHPPRAFVLTDTLRYLALSAVGGGMFSAGAALRQFGASGFGTALATFAGLSLFYALPKLGWVSYLLLRNGSLEGSLRQVGLTVLDGLEFAGLLAFAAESYGVTVDSRLRGEKVVSLRYADRASERVFLDALMEVLGPVANPRYLLVRKSRFGPRWRTDFHAVPSALGQRKETAELFACSWRKRVGPAELVFTRTGEGRRMLLRARTLSLASGFQRTVERLSAWQ